jgi:hypothetical protein
MFRKQIVYETIRPKDGVIVFLDALGVSNHSIEESQDFIRNRDCIIKSVKDLSARLTSEKNYGNLEVYTFGDNLLLAFEKREIIGPPLVILGRLLRYMMVKSMERRILWRGALSIGKYIEHKQSNTLIGPAIADAAAWCEAANWFGIMSTPYSGLVVKQLFDEMGESHKLMKDLSETFIDYEVPLEGGRTLPVPAIGWPFELREPGTVNLPGANAMSPLAIVYKILSEVSIPSKTEDKYFNTIMFLNHCQKQMGK